MKNTRTLIGITVSVAFSLLCVCGWGCGNDGKKDAPKETQRVYNASGTWEMALSDGSTRTLTLSQSSGKIAGTLSDNYSQTYPVKGTVSGDQIEFTVDDSGRYDKKTYAGQIIGKAMSGTGWSATKQY